MEIKKSQTPKLSVRNISSSVLNTSSATSLKGVQSKEKFRIKKPGSVIIGGQLNNAQIVDTLTQTNQTLVQIQQQLALDFAMRAAQEKQEVKKIRTNTRKAKIAAEEGRLEKGISKIGEASSNIISKATRPVMGIFDKIKEFFGLILANIVLNQAFDWLQDKDNQKLLNTIFDWIGKSFVPIVTTIVGIKVFGFVSKVWRIGKFLLGIPGKIFKRLFRAQPPSPRGGGGGGGATTGGNKGGGTRTSSNTRPTGGGSTRITTSGGKSIRPTTRPGIGRRIGRGGWIGTGLMIAADLFMPQLQDAVAGIGENFGIGMRTWSPEKLNYEYLMNEHIAATSPNPEMFAGGPVDTRPMLAREYERRGLELPIYDGNEPISPEELKREFAGLNIPPGMKAIRNPDGTLGLVKLSQGGSVPGNGPGTVDSVPAMLAPGEEVVRTSSAMLFRPLLKDINENAGRKYTEFARAVDTLKDNSGYQYDVSREYSKVIEDFSKILKSQIDEKRRSNRPTTPTTPTTTTTTTTTPTTTPTPTPSPASISSPSESEGRTPAVITPAPSSSSDDKSVVPPKASVSPSMATPPSLTMPSTSKPNISFVDMPVQRMSDMGTMPSMEKTATDVPLISSINEMNPYMMLTPDWYGIYM